jgi:hypothetical protein
MGMERNPTAVLLSRVPSETARLELQEPNGRGGNQGNNYLINIVGTENTGALAFAIPRTPIVVLTHA